MYGHLNVKKEEHCILLELSRYDLLVVNGIAQSTNFAVPPPEIC